MTTIRGKSIEIIFQPYYQQDPVGGMETLPYTILINGHIARFIPYSAMISPLTIRDIKSNARNSNSAYVITDLNGTSVSHPSDVMNSVFDFAGISWQYRQEVYTSWNMRETFPFLFRNGDKPRTQYYELWYINSIPYFIWY